MPKLPLDGFWLKSFCSPNKQKQQHRENFLQLRRAKFNPKQVSSHESVFHTDISAYNLTSYKNIKTAQLKCIITKETQQPWVCHGWSLPSISKNAMAPRSSYYLPANVSFNIRARNACPCKKLIETKARNAVTTILTTGHSSILKW